VSITSGNVATSVFDFAWCCAAMVAARLANLGKHVHKPDASIDASASSRGLAIPAPAVSQPEAAVKKRFRVSIGAPSANVGQNGINRCVAEKLSMYGYDHQEVFFGWGPPTVSRPTPHPVPAGKGGQNGRDTAGGSSIQPHRPAGDAQGRRLLLALDAAELRHITRWSIDLRFVGI
jgi:hypothetical protein